MEKKDVMYVVIAFCILLVIALVIKPMMTGKPVNTGIASPVKTQQVPSVPINNQTTTISLTPLVTTIPPTPVPTWDTSVKKVQFVDPATYGISLNESLPNGTRIDNVIKNTSMTTYAAISGKFSGTTQVIPIPFPYWELSYTVDPTVYPTGGTKPAVGPALTPIGGEGGSHSGITGSYTSVIPVFTIQVIDADDPNRIVRSITPPGGLDKNLWTGVKKTSSNPMVTPTKSKYGAIAPTPVVTIVDPRPWKEKFYEGQRNYFFVITAKFIDSYKLDIKVPSEYIGKY